MSASTPLLPLDRQRRFWQVAVTGRALAAGPVEVEVGGRCVTLTSAGDRITCSDPDAEVARRYGHVWLCWPPALAPLPDVPELEDGSFRVVVPEPYTWRCSALRRLENFVDFQHFAWVHEGLLGTRDNPFVPDHEVTRVGEELRFSAWISEPNDGEVKRQLRLDGDSVVVENSYRVFPAAAVRLRREFPNGAVYVLFASATPVAEDICRTHWWIARNYALDESDDGFVGFERLILDADQPIVESQRPSVIPDDITVELHVRDLDRVSIAYRRFLSAYAGTPAAPGDAA